MRESFGAGGSTSAQQVGGLPVAHGPIGRFQEMKRNGEACHNPDHEPYKSAVTERPVMIMIGPRIPL